jgi:hypothetical protein
MIQIEGRMAVQKKLREEWKIKQKTKRKIEGKDKMGIQSCVLFLFWPK